MLDGDTTRRGFGDLHQGLFAVSIDVAMRRGQAVAALELAEQARARALLDLMQHGRAADASQAPPRLAEMQAMARELDTTVLVYWVDRASTFAWVVSADAVRGHRLTIGERALRQLVRWRPARVTCQAPSTRRCSAAPTCRPGERCTAPSSRPSAQTCRRGRVPVSPSCRMARCCTCRSPACSTRAAGTWWSATCSTTRHRSPCCGRRRGARPPTCLGAPW